MELFLNFKQTDTKIKFYMIFFKGKLDSNEILKDSPKDATDDLLESGPSEKEMNFAKRRDSDNIRLSDFLMFVSTIRKFKSIRNKDDGA